MSDINFKTCEVTFKSVKKEFANMDDDSIFYDKLIFGVGKSGIDFISQITITHNNKT